MLGQATTTTYTWDGALATSLGGSSVNLGGWTEVTGYTGTSRTSTVKTDLYAREVWKSDLGSNVFTSLYDGAGRLITRGGTSWSWYNTGLVKQVGIQTGTTGSNEWEYKQNDYGYDAVGQRISEAWLSQGTLTWTKPPAWWFVQTYVETWSEATSQSASYDALGRLGSITLSGNTHLPSASVAYKYDAGGNVRRVTNTHDTLSQTGNANGAPVTEDQWFRYDAMNRLIVDKGVLSGTAGASGTQVVRGTSGQEIAYDALGQRVSVARTDYAPGSWVGDWEYGYYLPGYYQESREIYNYDGAGRLGEIRVAQGSAVDEYSYTGTVPAAASGPTAGVRRSLFTYDLAGRQLTQTDYAADGTSMVYSRTATYDAAGKLTSDTSSTVKPDGTWMVSTGYAYTAASGGEYYLGAVASMTAYTYKNGSYQNAATTTNAYAWRNGPLQSGITWVQGETTYTTELRYDSAGTLRFAHIRDGKPRRVYYNATTDGQVIRRGEEDYVAGGDPYENWYRFNGREWGYTGNNGTSSRPQ